MNIRIYCQAADDAASFSNETDWNTRIWTTAYKDTVVAAWGANTWDTIDIKDPVQEVINRAGWASMNALVISASDNGSTSNAYRALDNAQYNGLSEAPKVMIFWSDPSSGPVVESHHLHGPGSPGVIHSSRGVTRLGRP